MVLARFERDFTDDSGNLLTGNVTVAVAREGGGAATVYSDREGASSLGSTWVQDGGAVAFHAVGGAYRITASQGAFSRVLRYQAIGTSAERDVDGTTITGLQQLLYHDEADSSEHASSTSESAALKTYTLAANDYDYLKIEVVVQSRLEQDAQTKADFTWRLKAAGATVTGGTFTQRLIADSTAGTDSGERITTTFSAIIAGGQSVSTALAVTAQMTVSNAATGALVKKFRVYGIKDQPLDALVGPSGAGDVYALSFGISGVTLDNEDVEGSVFTDTITFPSGLGTSRARCRVAPTSTAVFQIIKVSGGVPASVGTVTFSAGSLVGVVSSSGAIVCAPGDELNLRAPTPADATLSGTKITLRGSR